MAVPHPSTRVPEVVRLICRLGGAPDLRSYLGVSNGVTGREAVIALERKRREMERALSIPEKAREAELFLENYGLIRDALEVDDPSPAMPPDWYAVLGVRADAPFAAIERAWRSSGTEDRNGETLVAQAWRVLGDPARRASYDRTRSDFTAVDNRPDDDALDPLSEDGARLSIPGPDVRSVELDGSAPAVIVVPLVVRGRGRWRGTIQTDHPAVSTQPDRMLMVGPGRHSIAVTIDPKKVRQRTLTVTVTLGNGQEQHVVVLRTQRVERSRSMEWAGLAAGGLVLLAAGWWLGARTLVSTETAPPDSVGDVAQIPTAQPCLAGSYAPLPAHIDVHVDGLGRPTGVSFGGPASSASQACVRDVVLGLEFPPTRNGRPAFHRYLVSPSPVSPPSSPRGVP